VTTKFYEIIRPDVIDITFTYEWSTNNKR
jgi:hypothetical protein